MTEVAGAAATAHMLTDAGPDGRVKTAEAHGECANCAARLQGAYCHACGQKAHLHSRLTHLLEEMVEGIAHFDGRLWRTLPLLAFRPGRLSRAWMEGKRARYVSPLHVFLFGVFLLFLIPSFTGRHLLTLPEGDSSEIAAAAATDPEVRAKLDEARRRTAAARARIEVRERPPPATPQSEAGQGDAPGFLKSLDQRWRKAKKNPEFYGYKIEALAYKLSFVTVPISMAILGVLLAFKRGYSFYDHGVVSLYGVGFLVLLLAVASLFTGALGDGLQRFILLLAAPVHAIVHLHGAYRLSWFGATLRGLFLGVFSAIGFGLFVTGVFALGLYS